MSEEEDIQQSNEIEANPEPVAARGTTPAWPFILLVMLFFGGMVYVEETAGAFRVDVYTAGFKNPPPAVGLSEEDELYVIGKRVYANCAACHQPSGLGVAGQFPPLKDSEWVLAEGPNRIIRLVLDGVAGPMKVKGEDYSNAMVPWRPTLSDREIAAVLTFIRGQKEWGHSASAVLPNKVKAIRDATASQAGTTWTADALLKVSEKD